MKVTCFVTHPIQYQAPLFRHMVAEGLDLNVAFESLEGARGYFDAEFSRQVIWDIPLLEGYRHEVLEPSAGFTAAVMRRRALLRRIRAEAVWIHGWGPFHSRAAAVAAKMEGLPILLRGDTHLGSLRGSRARRRAHRLLFSLAFRKVDHFLAVGQANQNLYLTYGVPAERITLMPYAVDNEFFQRRCASAKPERATLRRQLSLPEESPIFLFAAKLVPHKAADLLLRAAASLHRKGAGPAPALLIIGEGPMRGELEALASTMPPGMCHFLGFKNQTELPRYFDLCDVFVLPSTFEPWGLVLNEVMNACKPVIVSNAVGAVPDLVVEDVTGLTFPSGDQPALERAMLRLGGDPGFRESAGRAGFTLIDRDWSIRASARAFSLALSKLASSRAA